MSGLVVLDVIIGVVFVYVLLSLLASGINEWIAGIFERRGKFLKRAIDQMLGGDLGTGFFRHPLIKKLFKQRKFFRDRKPSYVPSHWFSRVLVELASPDRTKLELRRAPAQLRQAIDGIDNQETRRALVTLFEDAEADLDRFLNNVEDWFDESMERVTGWYRRNSQLWLFGLGLVLVGFLNADTFMLVRHLWQNSTARAAIVSQAQAAGRQTTKKLQPEIKSPKEIADEVAALDDLDFPLGWSTEKNSVRAWPDERSEQIVKVGGLVASAAAVSLGAPVWFDALTRLVGLRSAVKPAGGKKKKRKRSREAQR